MILLSIEARDDISEDDPLVLELELGDWACWLEVTRCGIRMISGFSAHWDEGRWWKRTAVAKDGDYVSQDDPSTSDELADLLFRQLSAREELGDRVSRSAIRAALDEGRIAPMALSLSVMES